MPRYHLSALSIKIITIVISIPEGMNEDRRNVKGK